jgi:hypothetical protein
MLPAIVKEKIETRFGKKIRYTKDCFVLAASISKTCDEKISPTTIMRLFGLKKSEGFPRIFTLDVISTYVGYKSWNDLLKENQNEEVLALHQKVTKERNFGSGLAQD